VTAAVMPPPTHYAARLSFGLLTIYSTAKTICTICVEFRRSSLAQQTVSVCCYDCHDQQRTFPEIALTGQYLQWRHGVCDVETKILRITYVNFGPLVLNIDIPFMLFLSKREPLETIRKFWKEIQFHFFRLTGAVRV
jgi:hypothetical protein